MDDSSGRREEQESGPPLEERVRLELVPFADLVQRLEKKNRLADPQS
ncbi:MAG: hypothetical protein WBP17_07650 [Gemmatimonadota bacterium]